MPSVAPRPRLSALYLELPLLAALACFSSLIARSQLLHAEPRLISYAIMFDLTVTASLFHYVLGIRRADLPVWTIIPVMAGGLGLSRALLPADIAQTGLFALAAIALVECAALSVAIVNVRKMVRAFRAARHEGAQGFDALEGALLAAAPSAPWFASYARFELQVWTMFALGWFFKKRPADGPRVFTHHKTSHWFALVSVLAFLTVVEAAVVHNVLHLYHFTISKWIMSALSFYALVWLLGDLQSLRVYRSSLRMNQGPPTLDLRIGARGHAEIALSNLASVELGVWEKAGPEEALLVLYGKANVKLSFHELNAFKPMFGGETRVRSLLTQLDDPEAFASALRTCSHALPAT